MPESVREEKKDEHEKEKEDIADPEALQMSQTCWEFKSLLKSTDIASQRQPPQQPSVARLRQIGTKSKADGSTEVVGRSSKRLKVQSPSVNEPRSSVKSLSPSVARSFAPSRSTTTRLQDARNQHQAEGEKTSSTWDMFVLVLQCSDLQRIASKTGYEIDLSTLLVADPTASFFGVTLWRGAAQWGARIIRAGDLVRLNRMSTSSFRGKVQASSTSQSVFRVIWRNDTFTTPNDANYMYTISGLSRTSSGRGGRRLQSGSVLSQEIDLEVSREAACDLVAWAKREFPSVAVSESRVDHEGIAGPTGSVLCPLTGSLRNVRKGVETTVRACVLEVSNVEHMWTWETARGQRRKELISRATALLTDFRGVEMTLQLWSDLASEENITKLKEAIIQASPAVIDMKEASDEGAQSMSEHATTAHRENGDRPVVFEFTRLRPKFSFSCEALVLNTTQDSEMKTLHPDSKEALKVVNAGRGAASTLGSGHSANGRNSDDADGHLQIGSDPGEAAMEQSPASARVFSSVEELMKAEGFSGMARLTGVVVRKLLVDAPQDAATFAPVVCSALDRIFLAGDGSVALFLGDPMGTSRNSYLGGAGSVVCVHVDRDALRDILGGIPWKLPALCGKASGGSSSPGESDDAGAWEKVIFIARSLLHGLLLGGQEGEELSVVLACVASKDENGRVVPRGTSYRMVQLHANLAL